jgi:hypothetical protein
LAWIKFDKDLINDPRIIRASRELAETYTLSIEGIKSKEFSTGTDLSARETSDLMRNAVTGALVTLWVYADTHIRDGDILPLSLAEIDHMVGIDCFCDILGPEWVKESDDGTHTVLPGYCEKNGLLSRDKRRSDNAERQRRYRENRNAVSNGVSNGVSNAPVTAPRPRPRPDKTPLPPSGAFLRFWVSWPKHHRKQSQSQCWEVWRKSDCDLEAEKISAHVDSLKAGVWLEEGGKFIPAPLVYLNQKRWEGAETPEQKERTVAL